MKIIKHAKLNKNKKISHGLYAQLSHRSVLNNSIKNYSYFKLKKNFSTSSIWYSSINTNKPLIDVQDILNSSLSIDNSNSSLVKYNPNSKIELLLQNDSNNSTSTYAENFPWFVDEEGNNIDFNSKIKLFDGVKLLSNFLKNKYKLDSADIPQGIINEILKPINDNPDITVLDYYNHVSKVVKEKKDLFNPILEEFKNSEEENIKILSNEIEKSGSLKPLGQFGETTINELVNKAKDLNWETYIYSAKLSIKAIPAVVNVISYGLVLRSYMKFVHNRPFEKNMDPTAIRLETNLRNRRLAIFYLLSLPAMLVLSNYTAVQIKDIVSIDVDIAGNDNNNLENNNLNKTGLFLILSNLSKKVPNRIKFFFKWTIIGIIVIFGSIFLNYYNYLNIFVYFSTSLVIFYEILNLYFLNRFINKNMKISVVLPQFIINWLKELEEAASNDLTIKIVKENSYIHISIYSVLIFLITILIWFF